MRILMIGDAIGRPGRRALVRALPALRRELALDLVIANGENAAGGFGLTPETAQEMLDGGVDVITSGNHIWDQKEILPALDDSSYPILRPANYPPGVPGRGMWVRETVAVVNLQGRIFMPPIDCPFRTAEQLLSDLSARGVRTVLVDLHAEATSEKRGLGFHLEGRISVLAGTHTHVPTADAHVLPGGTGYVTDLGMVGAARSVIGAEPEAAIERMITNTPRRLNPAVGPIRLNAVLFTVDEATGRCTAVERIDRDLG